MVSRPHEWRVAHMSSESSDLIASPSQTIGPFFHIELARHDTLGCLVTPDTSGERIRLRVRVIDGAGALVPDALVELYQADAHGAYARPAVERDEGTPGFSGFGRLATGKDGACVFETVRPGRVE